MCVCVCVLWPCETGVPLSFWCFSLFLSFLSDVRPIPVPRPIACGLCCLQAFGLFWCLGTPISHLSFSIPKWPFLHSQKHYLLKRKCPILTRKKRYYISGGERQKDRWFQFHACTGVCFEHPRDKRVHDFAIRIVQALLTVVST